MCESGRPAQASSQPRRPELPARDDDLAEAQVEDGLGVMRDAPVAFARIGLGRAHREHRPTAERGCGVRRVRERERTVAEPRAGADDPGPDRADDRVVVLRPRPTRARRRTVTHSTSPSRHGATATATPSRPRSCSARTASDSDTGSAPPATCTYATRTPASAAHTGATWLCSVQRRPAARRARRQLAVLLAAPHRDLARRVRQRHHVRARLRREPEPARQVRVEDVEAARAELEQARLLVHEHVVPDLDLASQPRIGDARDPVHLEPDEPVVPLARSR